MPGSLVTQIFPPCRSIIFRHNASPIPLPVYSCCVCRRLKITKISSQYPGAIPIPLSATENIHPPDDFSAFTSMHGVELLRGLETASLVRLILLDVNLPKVNGQAVLRQIKNDPILRRVPVVMFSTSRAARDIRGSYESGANSYVVKPGGLKDFLSAVRSLSSYWLECAILPAGSEHG